MLRFVPGAGRKLRCKAPNGNQIFTFAIEKRRRKAHAVPVHRTVLSRLLAAILFLAAALNLAAQGTAISYQGRLNVSGTPANTNYDFRFAVFNAPTNGTLVSVWLTNNAVPVSNGLFTVILDFGSGVFDGTSNGSNDWLDIAVCAVGVTSFTELTPRQPILPVPYALFATSASNLLGSLLATQITGTISSALISGVYSNSVNFVNATNSFAGNGSDLTSLNASQITSGTLADTRLASDVALLDQNQTFAGANTFNGANSFTASNSFTGPNGFAGANTFAGTGTYNGVNTFSNFGNSFSGSFFGNGLVGWVAVSGTTQLAARDHGYMLTSSGLTTVTLPPSSGLTSGDIVRVSGGGGGGWLVAVNSGQSILGNFAAYTNSFMVSLPTSPTINAKSVAASADGVRMYAVGSDVTGVYASSDSGHTWGLINADLGSTYYYNSVACSADGKTLYAQRSSGNTIQESTNGGRTWSSSSTGYGYAIACTASGTLIPPSSGYNFACSGNGTYLARLTVASGAIYIGSSGGGWISVKGPPGVTVTSLAGSSDCTRLVAAVTNGLLYASSNQGSTWTTLTVTNQAWSGVWMSPDGSKFAASVSEIGSTINGGVFSCVVSPQPGTVSTVSICGSQGSAVELQYLGGNQFMPVSATGLLWAN